VERPGTGTRAARAEHEIRVARDDGRGDERQILAGERAVAVHEADDLVGGRDQAGEARGAETAARLDDHARTQLAGDVGSAVGLAVVDDDRVEAARQPGKNARQRGRFVERGQDDVGHGETVTPLDTLPTKWS